jgi:hypothetical protein
MAVSYSYVRGVSTCGSAISGEGSCAVGMRERVERLGRRAAEALSHSTPPPRPRLVSVVHNVEVRDRSVGAAPPPLLRGVAAAVEDAQVLQARVRHRVAPSEVELGQCREASHCPQPLV